MNRRDLLRGVAGLTAGLVLPSTVQENAETARRYWALGAMPGKELPIIARAGDTLTLEFGNPLPLRRHWIPGESLLEFEAARAITITLTRHDDGSSVVVFQGPLPFFGSVNIPNLKHENKTLYLERTLFPGIPLTL